MADIKENEMTSKSSVALTDKLRLVGASDNASYNAVINDIAKAIIQNYTDLSLAGSNQSIKAALDSLNSKITVVLYTVTPESSSIVSPYSAFKEINLSSDISEYGTPIGLYLAGGGSTNPAIAKFNQGRNAAWIYASNTNSINLYVVFMK